ncbi:MAG: hypothetical protein UR39_C0003G0069 [Candidatus Woesebacteria bacterium GW2011_GWA1_33_30]|uniref:Uncharacterized protein n=1 Tax=Candidatus Woesebacteria bacterium GW2011_GWA2_33_28 TaxID=1618561 RepID=A0A0G0CWC3_9BACT|nr:MAG: hypothetical protein UR38_C0003G0072 [Candidatus Woesebacteria bacterium GW2011_GWA2_33_28]KKP48534.1 MAG: hypothetical protein UR39_C0003G0069 [Candidatus Woesebacteria bacterium GW2011_GWA1_33_30]KKP49673.1 MAG: hypothetical protein UR40_C0004G0072 [Microgenomates group bacterium GW2011_GWC1_33_32]KKP52290.1 MAG: hypothetical protein UR44_C0003G0072 [Candidatus Woesebacteria bacterium GW2011_GWB1_33_38]KKP58121.1 MAG: hypothetical protein UR48_C0007G0011 [Microgenomates group bacteriu
MTFSNGQLKQTAEILGNLSIAWFTAGIIAPLFISTDFDSKFIGSVLVTFSISGIFALFSISLVKDQ